MLASRCIQYPGRGYIVLIDERAGALGRYVSDVVVELLWDLGCRYLPMNPGSSIRGLHDSLANHESTDAPEIILCTHEEIAVSAAHAYSKATRTVGFAAVHDLVGLMHASMAVYDAWCDRTPLVVLGGGGPADPQARRPVDWFHSANTQSALIRPFVKWDADPITAQATLDAIRRAEKVAGSSPMGPTYVTLDAALQEAPDPGLELLTQSSRASGFVAGEDELDEVGRLLLAAEFPVVVAGGVGLDPPSTACLIEIMERLEAAGRDERNLSALPTSHRLCFNGDKSLLEDADVVLAIDPHDMRLMMPQISGDAVIVELSARSLALRPWLNADHVGPDRVFSLVSDPLLGLKGLVSRIDRLNDDGFGDSEARDRRAGILSDRRERLQDAQSRAVANHWDDVPISIERLVSEIYAAVEHLPWLLTLRNTRSWPEGIWQFDRAGRYLGHSGGGGMGYGPGALVGGGLAARDRGEFAVGVIGDGELLYGPGAIWTAVHHRIPMLIIVNNNRSYLNDESHQIQVARARGRAVQNAHIGTAIDDPDVDFASLARSEGAWAEGPISDPNALGASLRRAVQAVGDGEVALLDVITAKEGK
jgi:acetolactate synthase-1/2/3 large subunit